MSAILDLPHGIHLGVPEATYHERVLGLVNKGALDKVRRSPAHYKAWVEGKAADEESKALEFGKAFHCATLEPDVFDRTYLVLPSFGPMQSSTNRAKRDAWIAERPGMRTISADDRETLLRMAEAIRAHDVAGRLLAGGSKEVTARWQDQETGLECKARADFYDPARGLIVDLKTTENAQESASAKSFATYGYHRQDAHYRRGFEAAGARVRAFVFICIEKEFPFGIANWILHEEDLAEGLEEVRDDMADLAQCIKDDRWPTYPTGLRTLRLPTYARRSRRAA